MIQDDLPSIVKICAFAYYDVTLDERQAEAIATRIRNKKGLLEDLVRLELIRMGLSADPDAPHPRRE